MQKDQDLLSRVRMPTRYIGGEINTVRKDWGRARLTFALVFPDLYEIGMSHFGLQILYSILNRQDHIAAERFFTPAPDMAACMTERGVPAVSLESGRDLKDFDIIGVSLLYELNYTNILTLFRLSGIPFYAEARPGPFPLVIAGGPCAFNPEPLADFFDAFVIGDGEAVSLEIAQRVAEFKKDGDGQKETLLKILSGVDGVYIPSFFTPCYDVGGIQTLVPRYPDYQTIRRAFVPELTRLDFPSTPIVPFAKPVHDRLRLEIARGCSRGCRFCQAGIIYRPVRERSVEDLTAIAEETLAATGYADISLLSLSTGDYSNLTELMKRLHILGREHCNAISLPSIRAEKLNPEMMRIVRQVRKTGFTIAPEAGSQRLRDIINKNLTEESILSAVQNAFSLGWKHIKLYFMLGLPFETPEDIESVGALSKRLAAACGKGKKMINISAAIFVPKAHTPFQRCSQVSMDAGREKIQALKAGLRHPRLNLKWQNPEMSCLEGVWSRGDRRLSRLLVSAFEKGCRLDGWTDQFDFSRWQKAFDETGIDPDFYTTRIRPEDEPLPWDHIDSGVSAEFLKNEFEKAKQGALTPDCREHACAGCGVCDFTTVRPVIHDIVQADGQTAGIHPEKPRDQADGGFQKYRLTFSKLDEARFFGHLELGTIFQRAVKRAGLKAGYSQGFNPLMRISFASALPVGMESEEEILVMDLEKEADPDSIKARLNRELPRGVAIIECRRFFRPGTAENPESLPIRYRIRLMDGRFSQTDIDTFMALDAFPMEDVSPKGKIRNTDLRKSVEEMTLIQADTLEMVLVKYQERTVRPVEILSRCLGLDSRTLVSARIKKMKQG